MFPVILNESDLVRYLKNDGFNDVWKKHFPNLTLLSFEHNVYGCISRERIGAVDIFCQKSMKGQKYFIEVKYQPYNSNTQDFWEAFKILGYVASQNMYHFNEEIKPAIMVNKDILKYDFRAILYALEISYIAFNLDRDNRLLNFENNL